MKIGVLTFLSEHSENPGTLAREAENLGFESFWVVEHIAVPTAYKTHYARFSDGRVPEYYAHLVDPFIALAVAAHATSRIGLGTLITLLPERNPIETAKAVACLDLYSNGRLMLGVGAGWFAEEAAVMGVKFSQRWKHLRESVEAMRELWSKDEAAYNGEIIKFPPIKVFPKPVQKSGPPIILGAHDPKYALKRVARYADGWCPGNQSPEKMREYIPQIKRMAKEGGRDPERLQFGVLAMSNTTDGPSADVIKQYAEAGVTRLVLSAGDAAGGEHTKVLRALAPTVERGQKI